MRQLWAPWRMEYVKGERRHCILCEGYKKDYVVHRGEFAYVMMNSFPYTNGHLMIAPYRHVVELEELSEEESNELLQLVNKSVASLREILNPEGFNIGVNIGKAAGGGEEHIHIHVVPRWDGDTNFMPVLAEVKVIPEHLEATYKRLLLSFKEI